jgi:hypothetical protein
VAARLEMQLLALGNDVPFVPITFPPLPEQTFAFGGYL